MDEQAAKREADMQLRRREMQRLSQDIIRVYNPLDVDFRFLHDGYPNTVKARSYKDMERFKVRLFFRKIAQFIIGQMQTAKGEELLKLRKDRGLDEILDKYQENRQIWDKVPKMNDPELLAQLADKIIIGLVEEYGKEMPLPDQREQPQPDKNTVTEELLAKFSQRKVTDETIPETVVVEPLKKADLPPSVKPLQKLEKGKHESDQ